MISPDSLTFKHLRALSAVSQRGSITAAAEALNLTPPAIHAQIKGLEGILETPVLQRSSDSAGSTLTEAGTAMLEAAERIEIVLSQCAAQVAALRRGRMGRVSIGVVSTGKYFAPKLIRAIKRSCPEVELSLHIEPAAQIYQDLALHALDLAIVSRPPEANLAGSAPLGPHPFALIAAPDHPLADLASVSGRDLARQTFLAREVGSGTRDLMEGYLAGICDTPPSEVIEMSLNEAIKQAVMAGLGIAFLSLHTAMEELRSGRLVLLNAPDLPILRQWHLTWPKNKPMRPVIARVQEAIFDLEGGFLPD